MGLSSLEPDDWQAIVFSGIGGSGKSSAMHYLLQTYHEIEEEGACWITGTPLCWNRCYQCKWLLVDEIVCLKDVWKVRTLLRQGYRTVIATHLPLWCLRIVFADIRTRFYSTDGKNNKLSLLLQREGIDYTDSALRDYIKLYGQSYDTLSVILQHSGRADLATALKYFQRHCQLEISRY
jgi:hypothetical protein